MGRLAGLIWAIGLGKKIARGGLMDGQSLAETNPIDLKLTTRHNTPENQRSYYVESNSIRYFRRCRAYRDQNSQSKEVSGENEKQTFCD